MYKNDFDTTGSTYTVIELDPNPESTLKEVDCFI